MDERAYVRKLKVLIKPTEFFKGFGKGFKFTGIKICYKIDKFAFKVNKSKVVRRAVLT